MNPLGWGYSPTQPMRLKLQPHSTHGVEVQPHSAHAVEAKAVQVINTTEVWTLLKKFAFNSFNGYKRDLNPHLP